MRIGKIALMSGVAAIAMTAGAKAADSNDAQAQKPVQVAQNYPQSTSGGMSNAELAARVQALEDALASRDERAMADRTRLSTLEQGYNSAVWAFDNGRATFASGDGRFTLAIRARFQSDFAGFMQDAPTSHRAGFAGPADLSSGAVIRRAYFGIEGKAYSDFSYEIRFNAGGTNGGLGANPCTISGAAPAVAGGAAPTCSIPSIATGGEGDPLLNKAVITYTGIPNWHFNVGVIEPALMMEGTTSSASLMFLERPEIDNIAADSFGASDSRRGIEIGWAKTDTFWSGDNVTATGAFTGARTGTLAGHGNGGDEQTQILGRVTDRIWSDGISNLQVGVSGAKALYTGAGPQGGAATGAGGAAQALNFQDRPEIRVDGTRLISTGAIAAKTGDMIAFDLEGNWENFYLGGEWAQFTADRQCGAVVNASCTSSLNVLDHPTFHGYTLEGSWIITGETKAYSPSAINNEVAGFNGPVPSRPFSLNGGSWGAWELVARYSNTNLNWNVNQLASATQGAGILGGQERIVALGVNWYLNRNIRVMVDDNIVQVSKGTAALPDRDSQDFNVIGVRIQYAN
jgi:phosphate-selective porin OprO/OprP